MLVKNKFQAARARAQRGDTLVEVLISILIISMILTGAYVTTNRSALGVRDSQEQAQALKLIQGQVEQIRENVSTPGAPVFDQGDGTPFCLVDAVVTTGNACTRDGADAQAAPGEQPKYDLSIERSGCDNFPTPPCHNFTVSASWDSITAGVQSKSQITTRIYE